MRLVDCVDYVDYVDCVDCVNCVDYANYVNYMKARRHEGTRAYEYERKRSFSERERVR